MIQRKSFYFLIGIGICCLMIYSSCKTEKNQLPETAKKLPGTVAMTPTSFRCEAVILECKSENINFKVTKIVEHGSSLFYSVSAGDTLLANFQSENKIIYSPMKNVVMLIEERVKLNSDKPEFIVKQIK